MEKEPAPSPLSSVDVALVRAARVWGGGPVSGLWSRFPAERRSTLRWGWDSGESGESEPALDRLRREHEAQARADLSRVHVSWWVRTLKDEPPSVRRAVVADLPAGVAGALAEEFGLSPDDLVPDRPANPEALRVAGSLWTVQLVGDLADRDDDPPVIAAVTRLDGPGVARLIQTTGLAKWVLTGRPLPELDGKARDRVAPLRASLADADPRFLQVAARDIERLGVGLSHPLAHAGMTSFARLLQSAEPFRMRWALQHLPYKTAKALRALMGPAARKAPMLVRWENCVLRAAWTRLHGEGHVSLRWGDAL